MHDLLGEILLHRYRQLYNTCLHPAKVLSLEREYT